MKRGHSGIRGVFWRHHPRGGQEVRLLGGGRARGDWWIRWGCPHGHIHRVKIGPKSLAQQEVERKRIEKPCPRRIPKPSAFLLADVVRDYLESVKGVKRSWRNDKRYGDTWSARFPGRTLEEITPGELEKIRGERLAGGVTPATVNREFAFLKHVYNVAMRDGRTDRNPVARLRMLRESSGRVRYLTDEEEGRLMKALLTDTDRSRVTMLLHTGLRKAEFLGLRWQDVDFKAGVLTIPRSKNGETRHVPMNATVRDILSRFPRSLDRNALVLPNGEGQCDLRWVEKAFPAAVSAARIEDFRFHDLRHTFASRLAMEGVDLLTLKELGGWKSLTMVQRYAHLSRGHRQNAIERLVTRQAVTKENAQATGTE